MLPFGTLNNLLILMNKGYMNGAIIIDRCPQYYKRNLPKEILQKDPVEMNLKVVSE